MWQDGLALLIVAIAVLAMLRSWLPFRWFRFGSRNDGNSPQNAPPTDGCGGCVSNSSCFKAQFKVYPVAAGRGKRLPSDHC